MRKPLNKTAKELTADQVATLKENAAGILAQTRKSILNCYPFVGSIAMSLDIVPTRDCRCTTMATDGKAIYCDIDFLASLSTDDRMFIVAHEIYHNVMLHSLRRENRDHKIFNIATDMEINQILKNDGLAVPSTALLPASYRLPDGLSAEEYYDRIVNDDYMKQKAQDSSNSNSQNGSGNADGELSGQFDTHIYDGEELQEKGDETKQDRYGKVGYDPDFKPNVTREAVERVREAAVSAAQMIQRQGGHVPSHIEQIIKNLLEPKLDWKELLSQFVTKCNGDIRTWNRCNRRFISSRTYLPSSYSDRLKIVVGIDTSGSVYDYIEKFLAEVNGIVKNFDYELTIVQCDTMVRDVMTYDEMSPLDLEHTEFKVAGGGGTMLTPIFDYVRDNNIECDCCVMLTDGYTETFDEKNMPEFPVLWCVTKDGTKDNIKFGEVCDL